MYKIAPAKIERYNKWIKWYHHNKLFGNNQRQFYGNLNSQPDSVSEAQPGPNKDECLSCWRKIWEDNVEHNSKAGWIPSVREALGRDTDQPDTAITRASITVRVKKMANRSSPGTDGLHAYWLKHFSALHDWVSNQKVICLTSSTIPEWLTIGRTYLILKDPAKGPTPYIYSPGWTNEWSRMWWCRT